MKSRSHIVAVGSSSTWSYLALEDSNDRPLLVTFNNTGSVAIYIKWMNVNEGNGHADDRFYLAPGTSKTVEMVSSELPITRIGAKLYTGSVASTLVVSAANFKSEN